jgi:putative transposase
MPRRPRMAMGGLAHHVLNRAVGRAALFENPGDYAAFERVLDQAWERMGTRILSYCVMPNRWHLVLWPQKDEELPEFMRWLTVTHTHSAGTQTVVPLVRGRSTRGASSHCRSSKTATC